MSDYQLYLLFDRVHIVNANAISSPITYGFPAITGFVGAMHALSRRFSQDEGVALDGVLIANHECKVRHYRPHSAADYTFVQSRNPVKKNGDTAAIIEEGKADLMVSLVVEVNLSRQAYRCMSNAMTDFEGLFQRLLMQQRIAGGSVHSIRSTKLFRSSESEQIMRVLLPGFILMNANQEMIEITAELRAINPKATGLDALVEVATLHHIPKSVTNGGRTNTEWTTKSVNTGRGWLVPIPLGFQGISEIFSPEKLAGCRNPEYSSQFVESVYGLGKWVFPPRINDLSCSFWRYTKKDSLYLVSQSK